MTLVDGRSLTCAGRRPEFDELRFLRPTPTSYAQNIDFSLNYFSYRYFFAHGLSCPAEVLKEYLTDAQLCSQGCLIKRPVSAHRGMWEQLGCRSQ